MSEDLSSPLSSSGISQMEDWCSASASSYLFELWKPDCSIYPCKGHYQRAFCSICLQRWHDCAVPSLSLLRTKGPSPADQLSPAGEWWQFSDLRDPRRSPQAQQSLGWLVFAVLCKKKYGQHLYVHNTYLWKYASGLIFNIFQDSAQKDLKLYLCNQNQCNIQVIMVKTKTTGWYISSSGGVIPQQEIQQVIILRYIQKTFFWCSESTRYNERVNLDKHPSFPVLENHLLPPLTTYWENKSTKSHRGILDKK